MKKRALFLFSALFLTFGLALPASAAETPTVHTISVDSNESITPYFMYYHDRTVVNTYFSLSSVPDTYYYSEWIPGINPGSGYWASGYLNLVSVTVSGTAYRATFSGQIRGEY